MILPNMGEDSIVQSGRISNSWHYPAEKIDSQLMSNVDNLTQSERFMAEVTWGVAECQSLFTSMTAHVKRPMNKIQEHSLAQMVQQELLESTYQSPFTTPLLEAGVSNPPTCTLSETETNVTLSVPIRGVMAFSQHSQTVMDVENRMETHKRRQLRKNQEAAQRRQKLGVTTSREIHRKNLTNLRSGRSLGW